MPPFALEHKLWRFTSKCCTEGAASDRCVVGAASTRDNRDEQRGDHAKAVKFHQLNAEVYPRTRWGAASKTRLKR